jgi:hypothetical protein
MKLVFIFLCVFLLLVGCKKEVGQPKAMPVETLRSVVTTHNADTFGYAYKYNAASKLVEQHYESHWSGKYTAVQTTITRDAQQWIQKILYRGTGLPPEGLEYNLQRSNGRYSASLAHYLAGGALYTDSIAYDYNDAGRIRQTETFQREGSGGYRKNRLQEFEYDAPGNLVTIKDAAFHAATAAYRLREEYRYEYDGKTNPLILSAEGILLYSYLLVSPQNVTKTLYTDHTSQYNDYVSMTSYSYSVKEKPDRGTTSYPNATITLSTSYFYR